jgi:hypothetical protein
MIVFYCALQLLKDFKTIRKFLKLWLLLAFVAGFYGCLQQWFGLPKYQYDYIMSDPTGIGLITLDNGEFRKFSFLSGVTDYGISMAGSAIITLVILLYHKTTRIKRYLLGFATLIMVLGMAYSGTRTATLMLVAEMCMYILMTINKPKTLFFAGFFAVAFMGIMIVPSYGNGTLNRIKSAFEFKEDESLNVRDENRQYIQPYIHSHPIGGGVATTGVSNLKNNIGHPLAGFPTDSGLLTIVLEFGWIGLFIQCLAYFFTLQQAVLGFYRSKIPKFKTVFLICATCLFGYVVAQYSQTSIGQVPGAFLYYGLTAIIIRLRQYELNSIDQ